MKLGFEKTDIYASSENFETYINSDNNFQNIKINLDITTDKRNYWNNATFYLGWDILHLCIR